ncbi:hypothetical protein NC652_022215, partial [Populus alba x Populus x berolinensis]
MGKHLPVNLAILILLIIFGRRFGGFRKDNSAFYVFVLLRNKDVIPVHFNLCKRHVQADKIFSFCPQRDETFAVKYQIHYITVLNNLRKEGEVKEKGFNLEVQMGKEPFNMHRKWHRSRSLSPSADPNGKITLVNIGSEICQVPE